MHFPISTEATPLTKAVMPFAMTMCPEKSLRERFKTDNIIAIPIRVLCTSFTTMQELPLRDRPGLRHFFVPKIGSPYFWYEKCLNLGLSPN